MNASVCSGVRFILRPDRLAGLFLLALLAVGPWTAVLAEPPGQPPPAAFSVLHCSDIHVSPHLERSGPPPAVRGKVTIDWLCREAARPQTVTPGDFTIPPPALAFATGDLTEFGVIDDTWQIFEQAFAKLPCPLHVVAGNHDNTWVAMYDVLRRREGGENYSLDHGGIHFVGLNSASPQEPVPSLDAKTRTWLAADLARLVPGTPIIIALHHPPDSDEFAQPAELSTLLDLLADHNVVLLLYGHGHSVNQRRIGWIDGVMGGSTFGPNAGYGLLSVEGERLRYAYRYHREAVSQPADRPEWKVLLDKPLNRQAPVRRFELLAPEAATEVSGPELIVRWRRTAATADAAAPSAQLELRLDDRPPITVAVEESPEGSARVPLELTAPGAHLLSATWRVGERVEDVRTRVWYLADQSLERVWARQLPAAVKAGPLVLDDLLVVARTDGLVNGLDRGTGAERWTFTTGGEILGTPAARGDVVVFGSGDGQVYALDAHGQKRWSRSVGLPVYGWPLIDGDTVYIGDNGGRMHALKLADGEPRWTFRRADYGIESQPALWDELLMFGAWDGHIYALDRKTGEQRWKSPGPKARLGQGPTYYAPADCGPVSLGDSLLVCDRGYLLGTYGPDGAFGKVLSENVSAIASREGGGAAFFRGNNDQVGLISPDGVTRWSAGVPAGRFPIPPTVSGDRVLVCANRGRLSVLSAAEGKLLWSYSTTPRFYVLAPVAVDAEGTAYVAGLDGTIVAVRSRAAGATAAAP